MGGDFNATRLIKEKKGDILTPVKVMEEFSSFIIDNDLQDISPINDVFTWTNKCDSFLQIIERLDKFLITQDLKIHESEVELSHVSTTIYQRQDVDVVPSSIPVDGTIF